MNVYHKISSLRSAAYDGVSGLTGVNSPTLQALNTLQPTGHGGLGSIRSSEEEHEGSPRLPLQP